ncbi:leukocyte elastase inhibitor isoform X3 [Nilaparvata lugens]|uniref:leukocyte elastase inhibitor isoform X3 n=2 Tax=Nilaparvata lugens TaxID=108931 RepID=UPI00193EB68A|nr:leukocyte elastase inhibitor isoform X3 [Nilaparvata lugens]
MTKYGFITSRFLENGCRIYKQSVLEKHSDANILFLVFIQVIMAMPDVTSQNQLREVAAATNHFALDLHKVLSKENAGNMFFSPLSLQVALAMAAVGAADHSKTFNEMKALLRFPDDKSKMLSSYSLLSDALTNSDVMKMANRIYIDKKFKVKPEYLETTQKYFKSDAKEVDFEKNADNAGQEINGWVEQQTNNKIKGLIPEGALKPGTVMVLINAIHFKADWKYAFEARLTKKEKFYLDETRTVDVDMMNIKKEYNFFHDTQLKAKFLEMPYKGDEFSMILVLPDSKTGLPDLEKAITNQNFDLTKKIENIQNSSPVSVMVSIPKFEMESTHNLEETLKELGVEEMFSDKANFSNINSENNIKVSKVIQKAFVSVDEKGTEAAAATAIIFGAYSSSYEPVPPPTFEFHADHPFLCLITRKMAATNFLIFSGKYVGN